MFLFSVPSFIFNLYRQKRLFPSFASSAFFFLFVFPSPEYSRKYQRHDVQVPVFGNALDTGIRHIICINITDECIGRIFCQFFLEFSVIFFPHFRIVHTDGQETDTHLLFHWNSSNNSPLCLCRKPYRYDRPHRTGFPIRSGRPSVHPSPSVPGFLRYS